MDQEMKYIERVYQEGSFSKAAEALYMTQPALSLAVKRVEESIGAEIFDCSRRPLQLTDAGRVYLNGVQRIRLAEDQDDAVTDGHNVSSCGQCHWSNNDQ